MFRGRFASAVLNLRPNLGHQAGDEIPVLKKRQAHGIPVDVPTGLLRVFAVDCERELPGADLKILM
jgi:hypothetical protein